MVSPCPAGPAVRCHTGPLTVDGAINCGISVSARIANGKVSARIANGKVSARIANWKVSARIANRKVFLRISNRKVSLRIANTIGGGDYSKLFPGRVVLDAFCHNKNLNNFQNFQN